jgi:hypothetical protein
MTAKHAGQLPLFRLSLRKPAEAPVRSVPSAFTLDGDPDYLLRMIEALKGIAIRQLLDNITGASGFDPDDSALLFEADAFADERVTDAELATLNGGFLPPPAPPPEPDEPT